MNPVNVRLMSSLKNSVNHLLLPAWISIDALSAKASSSLLKQAMFRQISGNCCKTIFFTEILNPSALLLLLLY